MNPNQARKKIVAELRRGRRFYLAGHLRPDGDCLGAALAVAITLRRMGKKAEVFSRDPIPAKLLEALPGARTIVVGRKPKGVFDAAVFMECSSPERAGGLIDLATQAKTVINIDSHLRAKPYGTINLIEPDISSTSEQAYEIVKALGGKVDKQIATCVYVGLSTDTGRFHYSNTSPGAMRLAAELLEAGIAAPKLNDLLFATHPYVELKLLARSLQRMRLLMGGKVVVQTIRRSDLKATGALMEHSEEFVNFGVSIPGIRASVILKEEETGTKVKASLRSRGQIDVSAVALAFGGGGHYNAAGCTLDGPIGAAETRLLAELKKAL